MKKTYVITGATSGIGNALMKMLSKDNIVFAGYRKESCVEELEQYENVIPFYIDMERIVSISQAAAFIKSKTQKIDTLINVAGCVIAGVMESIPVYRVRKQFEVNTFSHLDFTQKLMPLLKGGKVINISSMASFGIFPFIAPYCASKRALDILFNAMSLESGLKVISIKPGVIATPLWSKAVELNKSMISQCKGHEKEMEYMMSNARRNGHRGLSAIKVAEKIIEIENEKNPQDSYTIGFDAYMAECFSKLPFDWQNSIVKLGMKLRIK